MRIILVILVSMSIIHAENIQQLIRMGIESHPSLQSIEKRLSAMDEKISLSQNFDNPDLSFTVNDMQFENFSRRDLEPMQYQSINFKQKFPWFGKLDAQKKYTQAQKDVIFNSYRAAKIKLAEEIRMTVYTIKEIEERIHIVKQYIEVTKQNIDLYNSYASTQSKSHTSSMNASLLLTKVQIKKANYKSLLDSQKAKLKYLVQHKVHTISSRLHMTKPKTLHYYLTKLENNPIYQMTLSQKDVAWANRDIQNLDKTPDPYVKVGYFNRAEFNDYASITIGASIP
ncbi:MAG TPA: hypothetical protein EYH42_06040, partial [Sulfurovum sp.]|nr:hypothetical protein [Sulfurovum sp.]